jgi:hypothetical protein
VPRCFAVAYKGVESFAVVYTMCHSVLSFG